MTHRILMAILALAGLGTSASAQSVLYAYSGGDTEARFGQSVSGIGDFDGDTRLDWAIADATSVRVLSGKGGSDILEFGIPGQQSTRVAVGSAGDVGRRTGGTQQRLRRHATDVQAVAAHQGALDQGNTCPEPGRDGVEPCALPV